MGCLNEFFHLSRQFLVSDNDVGIVGVYPILYFFHLQMFILNHVKDESIGVPKVVKQNKTNGISVLHYGSHSLCYTVFADSIK